MKKKEIYEHLAKIYLEAASVKNHKGKPRKNYKNLLFVGPVVVLALAVLPFLLRNKTFSPAAKLAISSERALVLQSDLIKINFNFNPATKETYTINLNNLDLRSYRAIGFSCRKSDFDDKIILRVVLDNANREVSERYIGNLKSYKWNEYRISLSEFKNITDWSKVKTISFVIEEWNTPKKYGVVYIDNVRLLQ